MREMCKANHMCSTKQVVHLFYGIFILQLLISLSLAHTFSHTTKSLSYILLFFFIFTSLKSLWLLATLLFRLSHFVCHPFAHFFPSSFHCSFYLFGPFCTFGELVRAQVNVSFKCRRIANQSHWTYTQLMNWQRTKFLWSVCRHGGGATSIQVDKMSQ